MKNKITPENINQELKTYFSHAKNIKCPKSMKQNLYAEIFAKKSSWYSNKLAIAGLSLAFVATVMFNITNQHKLKNEQLNQAQTDIAIAMHYMNRVSLKSLTAVNNKGIKPGLIKPLARSYASL